MTSKTLEPGQVVTVKEYGPNDLTGRRPWRHLTGRVFRVYEHSAVIDVTDCKGLSARQKTIVNNRINVSFKNIAQASAYTKGVAHESSFNGRKGHVRYQASKELQQQRANRVRHFLDLGYLQADAAKLAKINLYTLHTIAQQFDLTPQPRFSVRWTHPNGITEYVETLHGAEDRGLMRPGQRGHIVNEKGTIDTGKWVRLKDGSFIPAPRVEGVAVG